jgi:hypothetical protein
MRVQATTFSIDEIAERWKIDVDDGGEIIINKEKNGTY